jgi:hypothetical protein
MKGKGERRRPCRCEKDLLNVHCDDAVWGCYESELCLWEIRGVFIPLISVAKCFLNGMKWGWTYLNLSNRNCLD